VLQFIAMTLWCAPSFATPAFFIFLAAMVGRCRLTLSNPG
jgi:hypothetical protein